MLADLIREFCAQSDNNYEVYENYSGRNMFGRMTIGIIVKQDQNYFEMLAQLIMVPEIRTTPPKNIVNMVS